MKINRRAILRAGALAGAVGVILGLRPDESVWEPQPAGGNPKLELRPTPSFVKDIYRRDDQLAIRLECFNLKLLKAGQPGPGEVSQARLVRLNPAAPAYIVVDFGPQHLAEHAFFDPATIDPRFAPNKTMLAGPSRLAFKAPAAPIPFTFGSMMAWQELEPSLVAHALGAAPVTLPTPTQTALEVPWRVVLSPDQAAGWTHPVNPALGPGGRAGLWHARLGLLAGPPGARVIDERDASGKAAAQAKARVVWSPDHAGTGPPDPAVPGLTSLDSGERADLVRLTASWNLFTGGQTYVPQPIDVEQLALSPLGAWLRSSGTWNVRPDNVDLKQWVHQAAMGRDHFVRTVHAGRVFPTGHRVELVKITEREFEPLANGKPGAVLRQRSFIVPQQRVRTFKPGDVAFAPDGMRDMPFKTIRLLTEVTPDLAQYEVGQPAEPLTKVPVSAGSSSYWGEDAFWPRVGGANSWTDFLWEIEAEDYEGRVVRFRMPMIYVMESFGTSESRLTYMETYYMGVEAARRTADLGGQRVALAKFSGGGHGETAYPLTAMTFGVNTFETPIPGQQRKGDYTPTMDEGLIRLDGIDRIRGGPAGPAYQVTLHKKWISDGDAASNPGRVFAALPQQPPVSFAANTSGGVATPDMKVAALSAITGPIDAPGIDTSVPLVFKPAEFFAGGSPKLLGAIDLPDIMKDVSFPSGVTANALSPVPRLVTTEIVEGGALKGLSTGLIWETTQLKLIAVLTPGRLMLSVVTDTYLDGRPATTVVSGELTDFAFHAVKPLHVVDLLFHHLGFVSKNGGKPAITVDFDDVVFVGALQFVNVLRQYINGGPVGIAAVTTNGGYVNVTPSGVEAGYQLTLPPVPCGAMLMENIAFGARSDIYFDGRPMRLRFAFAERHRPFVLTVMAFGGGGSLALTMGLDGLELFEMSLEFGAKLALDVGAASGSVTAMGGVYLAVGDTNGDGTDDGARLTGFLRLGGELDVLEMVSMSIEFYLALTYVPSSKSCFGLALVTVEVEVAFFSASVTLGPVKKTFAGGEGQTQSIASSTPKSFADMTSPEHWADYTDMFASAAF